MDDSWYNNNKNVIELYREWEQSLNEGICL